MSNTKYKLDRNAFSISTFEEASSNYTYWSTKSFAERLQAATYLIKSAYGIITNIDKEAFQANKRS